MPNTFPAPIFSPLCVLILSSHNSHLMKTEWLEEGQSEMWKNNKKKKEHLERLVMGRVQKRKKNRERGRKGRGVENTGSVQLQLRDRFCAREYVNSSFVCAVDWPLHSSPGGEGRGSSGLGCLCLVQRPSQASFSYTSQSAALEERRHFCQLSLRTSGSPVCRCSHGMWGKGCLLN